MKRIIFMGVPAFGHTNPTLMAVKKLTQAGHKVRYYSISDFKTTLENNGAEVVCYDDQISYFSLSHINQLAHENESSQHFAILVSLITKATQDILHGYLDEIKQYQPDVIVGDSLAFWAPIIAKNLSVPYISSTTTFAFNEQTPDMLASIPENEQATLPFETPEIQKSYQTLQELGYPTKTPADLFMVKEDCQTIVYTSRNFQPAGHTFDQYVHFTGPQIRESQANWEKSARPLIYISLGTINNQAKDFYQHCIAALADKEIDVVLSVGHQTSIEDLGDIPENIQIYPSVDQIAVLQQADVFLTHCGLNSTSEALYYQVPLLLFPQTNEQAIVAERVLAHGAGIRLEDDNPQTIASAVDKLLNNPDYKHQAEKISQDFIASGGSDAAVNIILENCRA